MRLLASTDIALRVSMLLGRKQAVRPVSVATLARTLGGLSHRHLHKIVQDLTVLGLTRTMHGINGGVLLVLFPDQIRLGLVARHLEQDQPVAECFRANGCVCTLVPGCRLCGMLAAASDMSYDSLTRIIHRGAPWFGDAEVQGAIFCGIGDAGDRGLRLRREVCSGASGPVD